MAKTVMTPCDKMVCRALYAHGCQTSHQLHTYSNRVFDEDYSVGSIGAALRKLVAKGYGAYSENEKGQKVYWLTEFGREAIMKVEMEHEHGTLPDGTRWTYFYADLRGLKKRINEDGEFDFEEEWE